MKLRRCYSFFHLVKFAMSFIDHFSSYVRIFDQVALFVMLVERVGMLQVTRVLGFAGNEGRAVIEKMYPTSGAAGRPRQAGRRRLARAYPTSQNNPGASRMA